MSGNHIASAGTFESQESVETAKLLAGSKITSRIAELRKALEEKLPEYEGLLFTIHRMLAEDEALVHILKEDEIGVIVAGLSRKKQMVIVDDMKKASGKTSNKALSKLTADDF